MSGEFPAVREALAVYEVEAPETERVPPGYKQTEVGVVPQDWHTRRLGAAIEQLDSGVSVNSVDEKIQEYGHNQLILKTSAVYDGRFIPYESKKIDPKDINRAKLNPCSDTIIVSRMNTPDLVGEVGYVDKDYPSLFLPDRLWMARFRKESEVSVRWLSYLLSSKEYKEKIKDAATGTSGSMKNISKDSLLKIVIPFPSEPEQRAIVAALSDVDDLISALDKLIAKKRALKTAAMQQLLTGKQRLPGFSGEWEAKRFGDIVERIIGGGTPSRSNPAYWGGEIPWITVKDFANFNPHRAQETITEEGLKHSASHLIPEGAVIMSTRMALGKAVIYEVDVSINQDLKAIFPKQDVDSRFLYFWFEHHAEMIESLGSGSTVKGISLRDLRNVEFLKALLEEQTAIATVLSDMDAEIEALEARREKTRQVKQGMMQELLTGRTRLVGVA